MPRDDDDFEERPRRRREENDDDRDYAPPRKKSSLGLILGIVAGLLFLVCGCGVVGIIFATRRVRDAADREEGANTAKLMVLGCQYYNSAIGAFPTNSYSADGKPLLSWRVHILPYIEQDNLYRQFNLNEPWDGPTNIRLLNQMPRMYAPVADQKSSPLPTKTYYRGFSSPGTMFARKDGQIVPEKRKIGFVFQFPKGATEADIRDSGNQTILFLEAGESVDWTKPDELDASPGKPFPLLGGARPTADNVLVAFVDGSLRYVRKNLPESTWRAGTTIAGLDAVNFD